ncbi:TPA: ABC transporter ATP-binding protein/permease [Streptococcus equi subsp. zooepidemicus]|uniref:ABC transporter ATP-binding protein n=1 Tax=Streptococcus equi subsp. zooepidemicus Sz4is TaxID=1381082 RepID=A0AAW3GNT3_STRSZ|nr:ABC transporter ATP-binding protein/permease [Streptococcus equi]KIS18935.1 ABC transporter ATP-binding protein [Streptococcus equi subsp. zooepidemicus Sz4is]HEL0120259.1 ABC transporter ATP-binding protein/permease [Streptococcus equi subsp. zooepidemicus]KIS08387.1 ABC transporter ATP-binding protein [Streptococcus equi subsp. zooepidemicus Sz12is]HEL0124441.1 ABC transporter ATP-binding protein/permease [Streptococcus equi subsp. zooepidemicus]HEL0134342.1 ABC transporter ATP-binding pr
MNDTTEKISRAKKKMLLRRLKERIAPKRFLLYLSAFLSWLQFLMRLMSFYLITKQFTAFLAGQALQLTRLLVILLILNAVGFGLAMIAKQLQGLASQFARDSLKQSFFDAFIAMDGQFDQQSTVADVLTVASQGIDSLDTYYSYYLSLAMRTAFNCTTVLLLVFLIYPIGGLVFILSLPLIPISIVAMQKRSKRIMNHYWSTYMDVGNLFMDDLKGLNTLYSYQADERYEESFVNKAEAFRKATMQLLGFQLQAVGYMDAVMYLGIGLSGFLAVQALSDGGISFFDFLFFILIATEFFAPIREQGYGMHLVMMNTKMADQIFGFLDSVEAVDQGKGVALPAFDRIDIQDLSFSHGEKALLRDITMTIKKGELTAVAGVSGQGKTSLAQLLLKRYQADSGQIFLGDVAIDLASKQAINQEILYVSDQSTLLNMSIYENLAIATQLTRKELLSWIDEHGILSFIYWLPDGIDTIVGENGCHLSAGQRQQVICARALLSQRSCYIFDEATSSLDAENEAAIHRLLQQLAKKAIVIVITHKMKYLKQADQVLFLSPEQSASLASPRELYRHHLAYRQLVDTQAELEANLYG